MPVLQPRRLAVDELVLRPFTAGDEPAVAVALEDLGILRWTAGTAVLRTPAEQRAAKWLENRIDGWARGNAVFAVAEAGTDQVLGSVTLRDVHRVPDQAVCAYWVSPVARGRRIAGRALDAAARWAFTPTVEGGLGLHRLSLDHALVNEGSCKVATHAGFRLEGTMRDYYVELDGRRHDSHLHARLATDEGL
ncbi:RimJ/RimL family protein N-acetyltransferase [Kribbella voronezhensis]|uniref:RimJ/RimL family protein N-acetyltransferase n=1 Tax=Kribbella voronezhensis TaxID=2512212 RepID=A0A4R7T954_9ACTN|nr:GNAT family protein [Kribbella voronezhensis]TDU87717.1 RimJ/RimL family protein N-acetyltransferase [Kribbella voronezhensis]